MSSSVAPENTIILHGLEAHLPRATALLVAIQHLAAMSVGIITPPLILSTTLSLAAQETAYLVSMGFVFSALGTLLQTCRRGPVGCGLLSVTGTSFAYLQPLSIAYQNGGLPLMSGLALATAPLQILLAPFLSSLRRIFTPLVSGIVVLLIGTSLIPTAWFSLASPLPHHLGFSYNLGIAAFVLGIILLSQLWGNSILRILGLLVAVSGGWILCVCLGIASLPPTLTSAPIAIPKIMPFGFSFRWDMALPFAFISIVSILESMGDMTATAQLSGLKTRGPEFWQRLRGGILADGLTTLSASFCGSLPSTTYAQNNGVIQITGVASRRVGYVLAGLLLALGLFPAVGIWVTIIPKPILGALALVLFGLVAVSGLRLITKEGLDQRNALIVAISLGIGLGLPTQPSLFEVFPVFLRSLLESPISCGGIVALLLSAGLPTSSTSSTTPPETTP
jgi:xanthine permease XanP